MVSKKSWEKFKRDVEGLTKTGVEKESWGRRLSNKDLNDNFSRKQRKATPAGHSSEADGRTDDDIKGFSSSDEDEGVPTKKCLTGSKRTLSRSVSGKARKRQKTYNSPVKSPVKFSQSTSDFPGAKQLKNLFTEKWKAVSSDFENSFTAASTSAVSLRSPNFSPTSDDTKDGEKKEERNTSEDIAWSDSDGEQPVLGAERVTTTSQDKIPFSSQFKDIEQDGKEKHAVDIVEFDSDPEEQVLSMENSADKESSPSISPNTLTPTPKSPKEEDVERCPPLDSSKKRKQKYLRSGLAERLRKLIARENSEKSFWFHKLQQLKEDPNDDDHSRQGDGTVTLRLVSENLDHGVHVIKCDVISHDVISERELPDQVIVLLDGETRKHLEFKSKPSYLRIYSPWKIFDLTNFSLPILLCITRCEVIPVLPSHLQSISSERFDVPALLGTEKQVNQLQTKVVRTKLFSSSVCDKKISDVSWSDNEEDNKELVDVKDTDGSPILIRNLLDAIGLQGQVLNARINFTARIQRVYWRSVRQRNQTLTHTSSLVSSIIERSRCVKEQRNMSLCFLVQDSTALCSEIRLSSNDLLRRPDWQELLFRAEGSALSFRGLRFVEHRKRKRRPDVFGLIDSLRCRTRDTKTDSSKCTVKQNICFTLLMDEQTDVQPLSADEVNDCSSYHPPKPLTVDDLRNNRLVDRTRVKLHGKLLHATFKSDERYDTKHVRLFISGIFIAEESSEGDISEETVSECVIQVRYSSGRSLEWSESTLLPGFLLLMQDLIVDKENPAILTADIFSKIQVLISQSAFLASSSTPAFHTDDLWRKMMNVTLDDMKYNRLKSLSHTVLPELSVETESDNLVTFEGTITDVDQVNAFCWFTCNECGSDDISELQENSLYICNACGMDIRSPVTNTHLEVYLNSMTSPVVRVKAKLLQSTISRLLPVSEVSGEEGYDVQCVLNKPLGPMSCYVLAKFKDEDNQEDTKISFKLEELDAIKWTQ